MENDPRNRFSERQERWNDREEKVSLAEPEAIPVPYGCRMVAWVLDALLVVMLAVLCMDKVMLPLGLEPYAREVAVYFERYGSGGFQELLDNYGLIQARLPGFAWLVVWTLLDLWLMCFIYQMMSIMIGRGTTIGMAVFRMRLVTETTLDEPLYIQNVVRSACQATLWLAAMLLPWLLPLAFVGCFTKRQQGIADFISRTRVVESTLWRLQQEEDEREREDSLEDEF